MKIKSGHRKWFVEIRKPAHCSAFDAQEPKAEAVDGPVNRTGAMFALEVGRENAIQTATESASNQFETHEPTQDIM